jgi:hypothetical protein
LNSGCTAYTAYGTTPGYLIDAFGFVHLQGMLSCSAHDAFTLPAGARPTGTIFFRVAQNNTTANTEVYISSSGVGQLETSGASFGTPDLDGISFRAGG